MKKTTTGGRNKSRGSSARPKIKMPKMKKNDRGERTPQAIASREKFARELVKRRMAVGFTQTELAKRSGVPQSIISRIEAGMRPVGHNVMIRLETAIKSGKK